MFWQGDTHSDARLHIRCNYDQTQERPLIASEEGAVADMDRDRLNAKVCYPGVVIVTCSGSEAQRLMEFFSDHQGDIINYPEPIPGIWYPSRSIVDESKPISYRFTLTSDDLSERRFSCKYND